MSDPPPDDPRRPANRVVALERTCASLALKATHEQQRASAYAALACRLLDSMIVALPDGRLTLEVDGETITTTAPNRESWVRGVAYGLALPSPPGELPSGSADASQPTGPERPLGAPGGVAPPEGDDPLFEALEAVLRRYGIPMTLSVWLEDYGSVAGDRGDLTSDLAAVARSVR